MQLAKPVWQSRSETNKNDGTSSKFTIEQTFKINILVKSGMTSIIDNSKIKNEGQCK